jgi:hypothetical protein
MKIIIQLSDESIWEEVEVDPRTLLSTDSGGDNVVLFDKGYVTDGMTLRDVIESGCKAEGELSR